MKKIDSGGGEKVQLPTLNARQQPPSPPLPGTTQPPAGMALAAVAAANGLVVEDGRAIRVKLAPRAFLTAEERRGASQPVCNS